MSYMKILSEHFELPDTPLSNERMWELIEQIPKYDIGIADLQKLVRLVEQAHNIW